MKPFTQKQLKMLKHNIDRLEDVCRKRNSDLDSMRMEGANAEDAAAVQMELEDFHNLVITTDEVLDRIMNGEDSGFVNDLEESQISEAEIEAYHRQSIEIVMYKQKFGELDEEEVQMALEASDRGYALTIQGSRILEEIKNKMNR